MIVEHVEREFWKDAIVQWPKRFLHTTSCNVHEPKLSLCSCGLETRLKDEIIRLHKLTITDSAPAEQRATNAAPQRGSSVVDEPNKGGQNASS